jgi:hypothetical protein
MIVGFLMNAPYFVCRFMSVTIYERYYQEQMLASYQSVPVVGSVDKATAIGIRKKHIKRFMMRSTCMLSS